MSRFVLYEDILKKDKTSSFIIATKELLKILDVNINSLKNANKDFGCDKIGIDTKSFHINNAKTLALANREKSDIVCIEDSSYLSLTLTKRKLINDLELRNEINSKLQKESLEINLETDIIPFVLYLKNEIGFEKISDNIRNRFDNFYSALYMGSFQCDLEEHFNLDIYEEILKLFGTKIIKYNLSTQSSGYEILNIKKELSYKMSGNILLDIFDNAADFVVVNDTRSFIMFDSYQKELEKAVGRDIDLPVMNISQIILMALGVIDKDKLGLDKHKIETKMI